MSFPSQYILCGPRAPPTYFPYMYVHVYVGRRAHLPTILGRALSQLLLPSFHSHLFTYLSYLHMCALHRRPRAMLKALLTSRTPIHREPWLLGYLNGDRERAGGEDYINAIVALLSTRGVSAVRPGFNKTARCKRAAAGLPCPKKIRSKRQAGDYCTYWFNNETVRHR